MWGVPRKRGSFEESLACPGLFRMDSAKVDGNALG